VAFGVSPGGSGRRRWVTMSLNELRLRSPADVVSAIPYLIGFHPADSVVVLVCDRTQGTCAMRLDLATHEALLEHAADLVARRRPDAVILAGYGAPGRVTPAMERLRGHLRTRAVPVRDALRVEEGRFWSYLCTDLTCCPPEGTYVDVTTNPATTAAIAAGMVALPDRRGLERSLAWSDTTEMHDALARAERDFARWGERSTGRGIGSVAAPGGGSEPGVAPGGGSGAAPGGDSATGADAGSGIGSAAGPGAEPDEEPRGRPGEAPRAGPGEDPSAGSDEGPSIGPGQNPTVGSAGSLSGGLSAELTSQPSVGSGPSA
jgi:hypothetical protein